MSDRLTGRQVDRSTCRHILQIFFVTVTIVLRQKVVVDQLTGRKVDRLYIPLDILD